MYRYQENNKNKLWKLLFIFWKILIKNIYNPNTRIKKHLNIMILKNIRLTNLCYQKWQELNRLSVKDLSSILFSMSKDSEFNNFMQGWHLSSETSLLKWSNFKTTTLIWETGMVSSVCQDWRKLSIQRWYRTDNNFQQWEKVSSPETNPWTPAKKE